HPRLAASEQGWALLPKWQVRWPLWAGRLALLLVLAHAAAAVFRRTLRLRYGTWRRLHNSGALLLLGLGFLHSVMLGGDFGGLAAKAAWATLLVVAYGAWAY